MSRPAIDDASSTSSQLSWSAQGALDPLALRTLTRKCERDQLIPFSPGSGASTRDEADPFHAARRAACGKARSAASRRRRR